VTPEELVRDFLANGGKVTVCPPEWLTNPSKSSVGNPWWVRSDWTLVKVPAARGGDAEAWLKERGFRFHRNLTIVRGRAHFRLESANEAMFFKLTWGGEV
jgi:hypothetical protein